MGDGGERKAALDFAARIRAAVGRKRDDERSRHEEDQLRKARIDEALDRLFDDLEAMGLASGVLDVTRAGRSIVFALDDRRIKIASEPSTDLPDHLAVEATGVEQQLSGYFGDEVDRWALKIEHPAKGRRGASTQVYAMLGMGMSWLLERGLDLKLGGE